MQWRKVRCMCNHILEFFVTFLFPLKFFSVRTLFFNIRENNIKKILFTCCIGDGKAASDEGTGGAPTSAAVVHEGTVPVAAFELLLLLLLFILLLLTFL